MGAGFSARVPGRPSTLRVEGTGLGTMQKKMETTIECIEAI